MLGALIFAATVTLTWQAPQSNVPIVGYKIYYGDASGNYTQSVDAGNVVTRNVSVPTLPAWFVVRSYNSFGESANSNEVVAGNPPPPSGLSVR